jgi:hypothetical protein
MSERVGDTAHKKSERLAGGEAHAKGANGKPEVFGAPPEEAAVGRRSAGVGHRREKRSHRSDGFIRP